MSLWFLTERNRPAGVPSYPNDDMFQTEPILALQAFEWLRVPMWLVSQLGYSQFLIPFLIAIIYLVDFRKGFVAFQVISWNGILTDLLKTFFALPRPDAVDSRVLLDGVGTNSVEFEKMGAPGFLTPLPPEVVSHYRDLGDFSHGFPSGHCSATASTWGSIALLFRQPAVRIMACLMILLMPVSRMFLGRHFLAGGLGGMTQGLLVVTVGWFVIIRSFDGLPSLTDQIRSLGAKRDLFARLFYFLGLPLAAMLLPDVDIDDCARLLGANLGWVLLTRRGLPENGGPALHRLARFLVALFCFVGVAALVGGVAEAIAGGDNEWTDSITYFLAALATIWGATELALKLELFPGRVGPVSRFSSECVGRELA